MIGYLEGTLLRRRDDRILVLVSGVGYEVLLPEVVAQSLSGKIPGEKISLYIYFHQTERQPKPVLIGFEDEQQKEFFERFISVEDIGPIKAATALCLPVREIACAIERKDAPALQKLKGIGKRTADKIVASLHGKMAAFAGDAPGLPPAAPADELEEDFRTQVLLVMVRQLGHPAAEAKELIAKAMKRNPLLSTPEDLFDEVYKKGTGP
ncbi:MAG: OB-fold domain-containing protein [Desulfatibacillaceae bacterium]|nr:OB-fold domain-containing protein [Desulfatibacillaceae bacterium]